MIGNQEDEAELSECAEKIIAHLERNIQLSANHEAQQSKMQLMRTYIKTEILHRYFLKMGA
ncbi:MAG: hypothetical protein RIA69_00620 [Cyclobacteriaceae bacterium]